MDVSCRGTSSKQHWADNLNYAQRPIDFLDIAIADLDRVDGLGTSGTNDIYATLRESDDGVSVVTNFTKFDNEGKQSAPDDIKSDIDITFQYPESRIDDSRLHSVFTRYSSSTDSSGSWDKELTDDDVYDDEEHESRKSTFSRTMSEIYDTAGQAINATTGILHSAAKITPLLNNRYDTFVHTGFWDAYMTVRDFIHTTLRQELAQRPAHVMCTGHSLGGALATLACLDVSLYTIPRVNRHLNHLRENNMRGAPDENGARMSMGSMRGSRSASSSNAKIRNYVRCTLYTFGSPRIGHSDEDCILFVAQRFMIYFVILICRK